MIKLIALHFTIAAAVFLSAADSRADELEFSGFARADWGGATILISFIPLERPLDLNLIV